MSNRKELTVITKAKKLMEYTFMITNSENRFPKKIRYTLVQRLQDLSMEIIELLYRANDAGTFQEAERREPSTMIFQKKYPNSLRMFWTNFPADRKFLKKKIFRWRIMELNR